jgi:hypothetical protein
MEIGDGRRHGPGSSFCDDRDDVDFVTAEVYHVLGCQATHHLFPNDPDVINLPPPEAANSSRAEPVTIPPSRPVLTPSRRRFVLSPATPVAAALVLGPWYDVVRANAVKVAIVIGLTFAALVVLQANTQVL